MCCLNLGSVLSIYKILLNFLYFAKDFAQNITNCTKENGTVQKVMCLKHTHSIFIIMMHACVKRGSLGIMVAPLATQSVLLQLEVIYW